MAEDEQEVTRPLNQVHTEENLMNLDPAGGQ